MTPKPWLYSKHVRNQYVRNQYAVQTVCQTSYRLTRLRAPVSVSCV